MTITFADRLNARVADSVIGRWFRLEGSGHPREREGSRFMTDVRAGITTWAAMAYIISVNASIVSDSGGTCVCNGPNNCQTDETYLSCVQEVKQDLITSTAAISALASVLMGALANLPVGMAPGMGLNAYFTYSVVGYHGSGFITYREALAAVFLEGWVFFILSLLGLRQWLARIMPQSLVLAVGAGIGLYISFIGLTSGGLNVIGGNVTNLVGLGGCNPSDWVSTDLPYYCGTQVLRDPTVWLGIFTGGTNLLGDLQLPHRSAHDVPREGISPHRYLPDLHHFLATGTLLSRTSRTLPPGEQMFAFFKQVVAWHPLQHIGNALDYNYGKGKVWYALITFLYVDILDTTGTLYSMAKFAGLRDPVTLDFENSTIAYCVDAVSISMGALVGTSPVTAFIESATGIAEGGKTGITAVVTGLLFFVSVFFAPYLRFHPIMGNWKRSGDALPAFLTILFIPLSYNIAYGVIVGVCSYIIINGSVWIIRKASNERFSPPNYDASEPWVIPPGGIIPGMLAANIFSIATARPVKAASDYPFEDRHRRSDVSADSGIAGGLSPKQSSFEQSEK
ncbi:hypothetical protein F5J12DRAFT_935482 [Pisolithus orientalis]|uniref:uncharacterized protein n=1 Tax=Pisolithus orientalis TaxID=936130 RepID=UPI0022249FF0|nr:uncharacterized protein F5J12DRAFT_935482 [Pisolithus orientalis]KAI6008762.1 hypothetical protein F5J12DRAFT_935482 [Pisolithus orientalis]